MAEVAIIYLPPGEGGRKQGVDDYLAAGHSVADLLGFATSELIEPPQHEDEDFTAAVPYRVTPGGLIWDKPTQNGAVPTPLTNFTARIVADVSEDDGSEVKRSFEIEATLGSRTDRFSVTAATFASMSWATEHLGASAIVYPGMTFKEHARTAIQMLSEGIEVRQIFGHTGWRKIDGVWVYLHGDGAIGAEGPVEGMEVNLGEALSLYTLPDPPKGENLRQAVEASLATWSAAPDGVVIPLHAAAVRAAMGKTDFSVHLAGPTGAGKSEVAALFQQHYGAGLDARNLASWESTENALEVRAFTLKDSLIVVDDFAPGGTTSDVQRLHKKADRLIRGKGNAAGRERLWSNLTARPSKPPRALLLSTGEDVPRGQSLRARMLVAEVGPDDIDWKKLTDCQRDAREGVYAEAMSGFVSWMAPQYEELRERMSEEVQKLREEATRGDEHKRTPGIVADLGVGLKYFLEYAVEAGAVTREEADELWERGWNAILGAAIAQEDHQAANEPAGRFMELISSAIASGRAHIATTDGEKPKENARALGWRKIGDEYADWSPQGDRIGWVDGENLYLEPAASYRVAQREAQGGEALAVSERTLRKRLKEKELLLSTDRTRKTLTVRRTIEGVKDRGVLHLRLDSLFSDTEKPDEPDDGREEAPGNGDPGPAPSSGVGETPVKTDEITDEASGFEGARQVDIPEPDEAKAHTDAEKSAPRRIRQVSEGAGSPDSREGAQRDNEEGIAGFGEYELIETPEKLEELIEDLHGAEIVRVDLETIGLNPATLQVRIISLTTEEGTWLVDCFEVDPTPVLEALTGKTLILHNVLFDLTILVLMGFDLAEVEEVIDTMVMSRLVENKVLEIKEAA